MNKQIRKALKTIGKAIKKAVAPYVVVDNYGTEVYCWTMADAMAWLKVSAPMARIQYTYGYESHNGIDRYVVIAERSYN